MKKRGDTLILVGAILSVLIIFLLFLAAYIFNDMADKEEIAKDLISGALEPQDKTQTLEWNVDYYYDQYKSFFIAMVFLAILYIPKVLLGFAAYKAHSKGLYIALIIVSLLIGGIFFSILSLIGAILSLTEKNDTFNASQNNDTFVYNSNNIDINHTPGNDNNFRVNNPENNDGLKNYFNNESNDSNDNNNQ